MQQDPETMELYNMAGMAISEHVNLKVKQYCFEAAREQTNIEFDECYQRLRYLNFKYFNQAVINVQPQSDGKPATSSA